MMPVATVQWTIFNCMRPDTGHIAYNLTLTIVSYSIKAFIITLNTFIFHLIHFLLASFILILCAFGIQDSCFRSILSLLLLLLLPLLLFGSQIAFFSSLLLSSPFNIFRIFRSEMWLRVGCKKTCRHTQNAN